MLKGGCGSQDRAPSYLRGPESIVLFGLKPWEPLWTGLTSCLASPPNPPTIRLPKLWTRQDLGFHQALASQLGNCGSPWHLSLRLEPESQWPYQLSTARPWAR